jgi:hypothetical protein
MKKNSFLPTKQIFALTAQKKKLKGFLRTVSEREKGERGSENPKNKLKKQGKSGYATPRNHCVTMRNRVTIFALLVTLVTDWLRRQRNHSITDGQRAVRGWLRGYTTFLPIGLKKAFSIKQHTEGLLMVTNTVEKIYAKRRISLRARTRGSVTSKNENDY